MIIITKNKSKQSLEGGLNVTARLNQLSTADGAILQQKTKGNILLKAPSKRTWDHPWKTTVQWYTKESGLLKNANGEAREGFAALINPGFVNGIDPISEGSSPIKFVKKDKVSQVGLGSKVLQKQELGERSPGLLDCPLIPLYESFPIESSRWLPRLLREMGGVGGSGSVSVTGDATKGTLSLSVNNDLTGARRASCYTDIFLATARPTKRMDVDTSSLNIVTGEGITYSVTYDMSTLQRLGARSRIMIGKFDVGPSNDMERAVAAEKGDGGLDYLPIATVYFLSPPGGEPPLSSDWEPFVQHHAFWNFGYNYKLQNPKSIAGMSKYPFGMTAFMAVALSLSRVMETEAARASLENEVLAKAFAGVKAFGKYYTQ